MLPTVNIKHMIPKHHVVPHTKYHRCSYNGSYRKILGKYISSPLGATAKCLTQHAQSFG